MTTTTYRAYCAGNATGAYIEDRGNGSGHGIAEPGYERQFMAWNDIPAEALDAVAKPPVVVAYGGSDAGQNGQDLDDHQVYAGTEDGIEIVSEWIDGTEFDEHGYQTNSYFYRILG